MGWREEEERKKQLLEKERIAEDVEWFAKKMTETTEELKTNRTGPRGEFLREVLGLLMRAHARAGVGSVGHDD